MGGLDGRVAVVTGGAQGLGEGIVRRLAAEGAQIMIADLNGEKAQALATELASQGHAAISAKVDVAERDQVKAMIAQTVGRFGKLDAYFNNAGFNKPLAFLDADENNFNSIMRVNGLGVFIGIQEAGRQMIAQGTGGKIINTASIAGRQGYAEFAPYCASKAAVISLTQAGARELARHKITVNGFAPGVVATPLWEDLEDTMIDQGKITARGEFMNSFASSILLGYISKPQDIAGVALFLASPDSDYITGQIIMAEGGMVLV